MRLSAFCDAAGVVHLGNRCPRGMLPIGHLDEGDLGRFKANCRMAKDNTTVLVPGIPEAPNPFAALDALIKFRARLEDAGIIDRPVR